MISYAFSAFFIAWVVSRAARWFWFKQAVGWRRAVLPNLVTMAILILLEVVSSPGNPRILGALILYGPAALILSLLDLLIMVVKRPPQNAGASGP